MSSEEKIKRKGILNYFHAKYIQLSVEITYKLICGISAGLFIYKDFFV